MRFTCFTIYPYSNYTKAQTYLQILFIPYENVVY